ncbi:MAG TPA: transporter substrate-binding domain-containing protein [Anseongella sp.]
MNCYKYCLFIFVVTGLSTFCLKAQEVTTDTLRVGLAGTAPFVVYEGDDYDGISVEIWQSVAMAAGIDYLFQQLPDVATALEKLQRDELDVVVGPVSITSQRAEAVRFTQPYFLSSLGIASKTTEASVWQHIRPFFSPSFFTAIGLLLIVLAIVGTLIWLAERKVSPEQFSVRPLHGIFNGIWFALVTMTTVGYGDKAPKTIAGKIISGIWMVIALLTATSLIAGISSTITVSRLSSSAINTAEEIPGKRIAVIEGSPAEQFVRKYAGKTVAVPSLESAFRALNENKVVAIAYDRPQLLYYLKENPAAEITISTSEYMPQGYGFAFGKKSATVAAVNIQLLRMQESGEVNQIVENWLINQRLQK